MNKTDVLKDRIAAMSAGGQLEDNVLNEQISRILLAPPPSTSRPQKPKSKKPKQSTSVTEDNGPDDITDEVPTEQQPDLHSTQADNSGLANAKVEEDEHLNFFDDYD